MDSQCPPPSSPFSRVPQVFQTNSLCIVAHTCRFPLLSPCSSNEGVVVQLKHIGFGLCWPAFSFFINTGWLVAVPNDRRGQRKAEELRNRVFSQYDMSEWGQRMTWRGVTWERNLACHVRCQLSKKGGDLEKQGKAGMLTQDCPMRKENLSSSSRFFLTGFPKILSRYPGNRDLYWL